MKQNPLARKSVKQMVKEYEAHIIAPPIEFRDNYKAIPAPRIKSRKVPVPLPRTKITLCKKTLQSGIQSFNANIKNKKYPLSQLINTALFIGNCLKNVRKEKKALKWYCAKIAPFQSKPF